MEYLYNTIVYNNQNFYFRRIFNTIIKDPYFVKKKKKITGEYTQKKKTGKYTLK